MLSRYRFRTWHAEWAVVSTVLGSVLFLNGPSWTEALGSLAVLFSFGHAAIADRMAEQEARRPLPDVPCYPKLVRYYVAKELLWLAYFIGHRSWSALVGVGVFLAYPLWRRWYRKRWPLGVPRA